VRCVLTVTATGMPEVRLQISEPGMRRACPPTNGTLLGPGTDLAERGTEV
jgi:hypothetical protein